MISRDADVMVHEATYIDGEKHLANNYHHSHIEDVFALIKEANVKRTLITHLSNRYNTEDINEIYQTLIQNEDTPNFNFVKILIVLKSNDKVINNACQIVIIYKITVQLCMR